MPLTQTLNEAVTEAEPASDQEPVSNQKETITNMLLDLSSWLQTTEDQMREKVATGTVSPSTLHAD